jgi:hypothetical protein
MRRVLTGFLGLALVLHVTGTVRADDRGQAGAIIDKAIKALGGEATKTAGTWKGKGTFYGMGDGIPYTSEVAVQWPDHQRTSVEADFNGQKFTLITVVAGGKGWRKVNGDNMVLEGESLDEAKEEVYASWVSTIMPLKNRGFTITSLGDSKAENHELVGVKVAHKGHKDISLFFDKDSGLLIKTVRRAKDTQGSGDEVNQETIYGDYKEVDGTKLPVKVTIKRDGKKYIEQENSDMKLTDKIDNKLFAEP